MTIEAVDLMNERLKIEGGPGDLAIKEASERLKRSGMNPPRFVSRGALLAYIALDGDSDEFKKLVKSQGEDNERVGLKELKRLEKYKEKNQEVFE